MEHILKGVKHCISQGANALLTGPYVKEEVESALKGKEPTKALGIDGLLIVFFYQKYYHIVGDKVVKFYLGVINEGGKLTKVNATNIVVIPKMTNPTIMANFRPISLYNVIYKSIAKAVMTYF